MSIRVVGYGLINNGTGYAELEFDGVTFTVPTVGNKLLLWQVSVNAVNPAPVDPVGNVWAVDTEPIFGTTTASLRFYKATVTNAYSIGDKIKIQLTSPHYQADLDALFVVLDVSGLGALQSITVGSFGADITGSHTAGRLLFAIGEVERFTSGSPPLAPGPASAALDAAGGWTEASALADDGSSTTGGTTNREHKAGILGYQVAPGGSVTADFTFATSGNGSQLGPSTWVLEYLYTAATGDLRISTSLSPTRLRYRAYTDSSGGLSVERWDDASPPAVAATVSVETTGCTGVCLRTLPDGTLWLTYAKGSTVYSRTSKDQGRTWSVADTIASNYDDVASAYDKKRGLRVALMFKTSDSKWYGSVGEQNSGGTAWTYSTPAVVVTGAAAGATVLIRPDGVIEFDYRTSGGTLTTVRCRSYSAAGLGTFS